jgi:hypothetical protein
MEKNLERDLCRQHCRWHNLAVCHMAGAAVGTGCSAFFFRANNGTLILPREKILKKGYADGNAVSTACWPFLKVS